MRKVLKFQLKVFTGETLSLPSESAIVKFAFQNDIATIWVEVNLHNTIEREIHFIVVSTGELIPEGFTYVETAFTFDEVYHLYKKLETFRPFKGASEAHRSPGARTVHHYADCL